MKTIGFDSFKKRTFVIKFGGRAICSSLFWERVLPFLEKLHNLGSRLIIVHGAGQQINEALMREGIGTKKVAGIRVTSEKAMNIVAITCIKTNNRVVNLLNNSISTAPFLYDIVFGSPIGEDYGQSGHITSVNTKRIKELWNKNLVPIISPLAFFQGRLLNVNADEVAGAVAKIFSADGLIILSDTDGVLDGNKKTIALMDAAKAKSLVTSGIATEGMIPKLLACVGALAHHPPKYGVQACHIVNFLSDVPLDMQLLSGNFSGTTIM